MDIKNISENTETNLSNQNKWITKFDKEIKNVKDDVEKLKMKAKNCNPGWTKYQFQCYKLIKKKSAWSEDLCKSEGGSLVDIKNNDMNDFIFTLTTGFYTWLGGHDTRLEGTWEWKTGEPNDHNRGEDCAQMRSDSRVWNDAPCTRTIFYVCQI